MTKSYLICNTEKFYDKEYLVPMQCSLLEGEVEGEAETFIRPTNKQFHLGYNQFFCHHDYKHNRKGRIFNKNFSYYYEPVDFYSYYNPEDKLALISIKTDIAIDFIQKLNLNGNYKINPTEINFEKMIPHIDEIGGAWIANLKKAHLKTAGFFGPHVNKSEEYKEAANEGNISSIRINYIDITSSKEYTVLISKKGAIVLYDCFETIEEELELVLQIYNRLIKPHVPA